MCQSDPQETAQSTEEVLQADAPEIEESVCVCETICEKLKQKLKDVETKEIFDATMESVRKRPLLGVLVAAVIGYFLGRLSKKFS